MYTSRTHFAQQRVVILGLARQGLALTRFFCQEGASVTVSDVAAADQLGQELREIEALPVELVLGGHPAHLLDGCDLLCLSGGVPPQIAIVQEAIARGIPLSNDSLLTMQHAPCPVVAITGSSGKTTTTSLVGAIMEATFGGGRKVHIGGNIGLPLLDRLDEISKDDLIVLELSSFQLELFDPAIALGRIDFLGPDVAAILNVTPNHLDRHPSMVAYADAKLNLLRHLKTRSRVVLSGDDPVTARLAQAPEESLDALPAAWELDELLTSERSRRAARTLQPILFSRKKTLTAGAWLDGDRLIYNHQTFATVDQIKLPGDHNVGNLLAAAAISGAAGASVEAMAEVATTFTGVPHRLETIFEAGGVTWINDSIATAPERAIAGLRVFNPGEQTLILLAGGKDKNLPWDTFADEVLKRVNYLIGFGQAGSMIVSKVQDRALFRRVATPSTAVVNRLDDAVVLAAHIAFPGTVVLLSPGGTSYDAYKNFEERGQHFRQLVRSHQLVEVSH